MSVHIRALLMGGIVGLFIYMVEDFNLNFIWKFSLLLVVVTIINTVVDRLYRHKNEDMK